MCVTHRFQQRHQNLSGLVRKWRGEDPLLDALANDLRQPRGALFADGFINALPNDSVSVRVPDAQRGDDLALSLNPQLVERLQKSLELLDRVRPWVVDDG